LFFVFPENFQYTSMLRLISFLFDALKWKAFTLTLRDWVSIVAWIKRPGETFVAIFGGNKIGDSVGDYDVHNVVIVTCR
jgi:hypothetical protein